MDADTGKSTCPCHPNSRPCSVPMLLHPALELGDGFLGLGGDLGVPAFFGFEADPAVVVDFFHGANCIAERQITVAEQARDVFAILGYGIFEMHVADEFL